MLKYINKAVKTLSDISHTLPLRVDNDESTVLRKDVQDCDGPEDRQNDASPNASRLSGAPVSKSRPPSTSIFYQSSAKARLPNCPCLEKACFHVISRCITHIRTIVLLALVAIRAEALSSIRCLVDEKFLGRLCIGHGVLTSKL